jgi:hypothetical protein
VRDKRSADANYRKIKLGLEGPPPKKPAPKKKDEDDNEEKKVDKKKNGKVNDKENEATAGVSDKPFKPTTTKKQLVRIKGTCVCVIFRGTSSNSAFLMSIFTHVHYNTGTSEKGSTNSKRSIRAGNANLGGPIRTVWFRPSFQSLLLVPTRPGIHFCRNEPIGDGLGRTLANRGADASNQLACH